jgi:hypothetical protein
MKKLSPGEILESIFEIKGSEDEFSFDFELELQLEKRKLIKKVLLNRNILNIELDFF